MHDKLKSIASRRDSIWPRAGLLRVLYYNAFWPPALDVAGIQPTATYAPHRTWPAQMPAAASWACTVARCSSCTLAQERLELPDAVLRVSEQVRLHLRMAEAHER